MGESDFIDPAGLARSAELLGEFEHELMGLVLEDLRFSVAKSGHGASYKPFARSMVERPILWAEVVKTLAGNMGFDLSRSQAAQIVSSLMHRVPINVGGIQASTENVENDEVWTFAPENRRRAG